MFKNIFSFQQNKNFTATIGKNPSPFNIDDYKYYRGVKAFFFASKNRIIYKFIIYGETAYASKGEDVLASAISILSINTVNSLDKFTDAKITSNVATLHDKPYLECELHNFPTRSDQDISNALIRSLALGVKSLENKYGSHYIECTVFKDN